MAVESKYFSVGRVVPWAEAGVGAVATQANVNPSYGPKGLAMMRSGMSPDEIMRAFAASDSQWDSRQLGIVDARGRAATWTGPKCNTWAGGEVRRRLRLPGEHPRRSGGGRRHGEGVPRHAR